MSRVLVVGASSGIGRAVAQCCAQAGFRVAAAARRADLLEELAAKSGKITAVPADVTSADGCRWLVDAAVVGLGGLDAVVYAAGVAPLRPLVATDAPLWKQVLDTNLVGASLVTAAAIPHLEETKGRVIFLSSDSVGHPRPGLVPYSASKAGLEETVRGWRAEHPGVTFINLVVGPTVTGMADGWDHDELAAAFSKWADEGFVTGDATPQTPDRVASAVVGLLQSDHPEENVRVVPGE